MPIYEYLCEDCHHFQQILLRRPHQPLGCKACGSSRLARKVSASSFHLKGGGWYRGGYEAPPSEASTTTEGK